MNPKRSLPLLLFFALTAAPTMAAATDSPRTVTGTVVDSDKIGVDDIDVSIYASDDAKSPIATTVSDHDGKFTLKDVPPGKGYVVKAAKRKSILHVRAERKDVTVAADKATDVGDLELKVPVR